MRDGSRPASRAAGAASPDFWSRSGAPQLLDANVKNPELRLQLMIRALEESRAKVAHLQRDRDALADALAALCATAGAEDRTPPAPDGSDDDALPRRLDMLSTQLAILQEDLRARTAAVAEAEAAHERATLQVVQQQQQRDALERELEEVRTGEAVTMRALEWLLGRSQLLTLASPGQVVAAPPPSALLLTALGVL